MTIDAWLRAAIALADQRGLPELAPLLESLAVATGALRAANFTGDAGGPLPVEASGTIEPPPGGAVPRPGPPSR